VRDRWLQSGKILHEWDATMPEIFRNWGKNTKKWYFYHFTPWQKPTVQLYINKQATTITFSHRII
jgi:hypothetical protein